MILQKNGLTPNKDVTSIVVGGQEETAIALRTGRIAAALLTPPRPLVLQREGFNRIGYSGDYVPTYPSGGIGVTEEKMRTKPVELGYRYDGSPIRVPDGTPPPPDDHATYVATTWPGARAPHVWLKAGRSTLDLFGRGFTLLALSSRVTDTSAFTSAAEQVGLPLEVATLDEPEARESYERPLVLVRPDGHVAWRGDSVPVNAADIIEQVHGAYPQKSELGKT